MQFEIETFKYEKAVVNSCLFEGVPPNHSIGQYKTHVQCKRTTSSILMIFSDFILRFINCYGL